MNSKVVSMKRQPVQPAGVPTFIGIDYHKAYSVYCVLDAQGSNLERGRIDHACPEDFRTLVRRWPECHLVFEASMNWHWLFEILEREVPSERIVLARSSGNMPARDSGTPQIP
jgi:hypothetical protein